MRKSIADCCGPRDEKYINIEAPKIVGLGKLLDMRGLDEKIYALVYSCRACGQVWEDHLVPFQHVDVHIVVKQGVEPTLPGFQERH